MTELQKQLCDIQDGESIEFMPFMNSGIVVRRWRNLKRECAGRAISFLEIEQGNIDLIAYTLSDLTRFRTND